MGEDCGNSGHESEKVHGECDNGSADNDSIPEYIAVFEKNRYIHDTFSFTHVSGSIIGLKIHCYAFHETFLCVIKQRMTEMLTASDTIKIFQENC
jgi:hypothetical protein